MIFEFCNVLSCLRLKKVSDGTTPTARMINNYEIDLYLKGDRVIILDGKEYKIEQNTCSIRKPGQLCTGIGSQLESYALTLSFFPNESENFKKRLIPSSVGKRLSHPVLDSLPDFFSVRNVIQIKDLYERLCLLHFCDPKNYGQKKALAEKIILLLAAEAIEVTPQASSSRYEVNIVKNSILENFSNPFSTAKLSAELGFCEDHLIRMFKKEFFCTPNEFLIRVRMENAKHLLINSSLPISDIAVASGYLNFSYFSASFKKRYGQSPREFRQQFLNQAL